MLNIIDHNLLLFLVKFLILILIFCILTLSDKFQQNQDKNKTYLYIYTLIGMINSVATFFRAFIFAYGGIKACEQIHDHLLKSIMNVCINI